MTAMIQSPALETGDGFGATQLAALNSFCLDEAEVFAKERLDDLDDL